MEQWIVIGNKIGIAVIATLLVWVLQRLALHPEMTDRYPFLANPAARFGLALMGASFAVDFFSYYVPAYSEIILNAGILVVLVWVYVAYKTGALVRTQKSSRYENKS